MLKKAQKIISVFFAVSFMLFSMCIYSSASSSKVYNIKNDFYIELFNETGDSLTGGSISSRTSQVNGVTYYQIYPTTLSDQANFYSHTVRMITALKLEKLSLKTEYNIKFSFFTSQNYSLVVFLNPGNGSESIVLFTQDAKNNEIINCNINFTLSELGLSSNNNLELGIMVIQNADILGMSYYNFTDIVLTDLDDNSQFFDAVLIWLNRIYYSIVGGTDSTGVSHIGIVQSIQNLGSTLTSKLTDCTDILNTQIEDCATLLANSFSRSINNLWINLQSKLNTINSNLLAFKSSVESLFEDKFTVLFDKLDTLIKGKESSKDDFSSAGKDEIDKISSDIEDTEGNLPDFNGSDFDNVVNTDILSDLSKGFIALNTVFSVVIDKLGFTAVIVFFLSFGLAIYIIGRKLG